MKIVEVQNLCKDFDSRKVLKNLNLFVKKREIFGIIGPSGSGKTTFLRILNLLETPTSGRVLFNGKEISKDEKLKVRRRMAMVFQKPIVFNSSVFENIAYGLKIRKFSKDLIHEKVRDAMKLVGLEEGKKNALKLSGGEQQRVALARVVVLEPELMLLDEPTANLDPRNVSVFEEALKTIKEESLTTIVMATHNMFQAERLADRVAFLLDGEFVEIGGKKCIFEDPQDERTAAFIQGRMVW
ncbi:MAG: phosphate ABC transporter ATP-binding protein [Candidatus Methanofastidiosia archaeon]